MKKKVLVVEDDPTSRKLVTSLLKEHNYTVITAINGEAGFKKAIKERPDLIVLDVVMPKKDGFTFIQELKRHDFLHVPTIIMMTVKDQMEPTFRMEQVADYFVKPLNTQRFIKRVNQLLKPTLLCPTCEQPTPEEGHMCMPVSRKDKKCDWCETLIMNQRHLCNEKMKALSFICNSCGRTAVKQEYLCKPQKIK